MLRGTTSVIPPSPTPHTVEGGQLVTAHGPLPRNLLYNKHESFDFLWGRDTTVLVYGLQTPGAIRALKAIVQCRGAALLASCVP